MFHVSCGHLFYRYHSYCLCIFFLSGHLNLSSCFVQLFDGHNGSAAAIYSKENLLNNVLGAIPSNFSREDWLAALPRALVAGFIKTDKDFQEKGKGFFVFLLIFTKTTIPFLFCLMMFLKELC